MASVTTAQLSSDADFAIGDFTATLTIISPASEADTTYTATRNFLTIGYEVEINGREAMVDCRWYLNINGLSTYPDKGWCFSSGGTNYKVADVKRDQSNIVLTLDCISQTQS